MAFSRISPIRRSSRVTLSCLPANQHRLTNRNTDGRQSRAPFARDGGLGYYDLSGLDGDAKEMLDFLKGLATAIIAVIIIRLGAEMLFDASGLF